MSKRIPFGILLANWIVGLLFVLLPPSADAASVPDGKSHLQTSQGLISEAANLPEGPVLEFDLKFFPCSAPFNSLLLYSESGVFDIPLSGYSTVPLFDVKQTFIHFFFTW